MQRRIPLLVRFVVSGLALAALGTAAQAQVRPNPPNPLTVDGGTTVPTPPANAAFLDNFEFSAARSSAALSLFTARGWGGVKAENISGSGGGYIYTLADPTGQLGSRVLALESRPSESVIPPGWSYGQTDYYLQYGTASSATTKLPANVWIQFWTYATPESRFAARDKVLYPCRGDYNCHYPNLEWLLTWGSRGYERSATAPAGGRLIGIYADGADNRLGYDAGYDENGNHELGQNVSQTPMLAGRWYQLKLHFDTSGAQGVYQAWIRERGQSAWTMVADWRGGVTPQFNWPIPSAQRTGHRVMRLPTTVNGPGDSTVYIDDFVISETEPR